MTTFKGQIDRELAKQYGQEALAICETGRYLSTGGHQVDIRAMLRQARDATVSYPPDEKIGDTAEQHYETSITVANETTLSAARFLIEAGYNPVALNFASATTPGGGFLDGARAQEEYLARSSGLYECIRDNPMYSFHREHWSPFYSDYAIYSPGVPVFRADSGELLSTPYPVSIISCAAVKATAVPEEERSQIVAVMAARIDRVLAIGATQRHDAIVLGAWGCGAFGNDPTEIAGLFERALNGRFAGVYRQVVFAIVDWSPERKFIGPFERTFSTE